MIRFNEFTDEMLQDIAVSAKERLLKLGIDAKVNVELRDGRDGVSLYLETTTFGSMPVIYKSIKVYGYGILEKFEDVETISTLSISLYYGFEYFSGGSNGVSLGTLEYYVYEKSKRVRCIGLTI